MSLLPLRSGVAFGISAMIRLDTNDSRVKVMGAQQLQNLFVLDPLNLEAPGANVCEGRRALKSTEAYFLVYRQTSVPATPVSDDVVPEPIRSELLADNERLKVSIEGTQARLPDH